jgi:glucose/arabinose dehydrogenase
MCLIFYTGNQFPNSYRGDAFLALHGSGNRSKRVGYSIVRIPFKNGQPVGGYEDFVTGWMLGEDDKRVWGRPVGLTQGKDGSLFLVDDGANKVWRIFYRK